LLYLLLILSSVLATGRGFFSCSVSFDYRAIIADTS